MTAIELLVILTCLLVLAVLLIVPFCLAVHVREANITCVDNLKQISLTLRIWEYDNGNIGGPRTVPLPTKDQTTGFNDGQIAWIRALGISNIVREAKILQCPLDKETPTTTNSTGLKIRISYFLNLDANEGYPQELLSGDDNLAIGGAPVKPGILLLSSKGPVSWTTTRHGRVENISLSDGSVEQQSSTGLQMAVQYSTNGTPPLTNGIAIS